ncbi:hypothetical protein KXD40_009150 [Peronospora effusa]|nr:hypothetical protein KXD40_009150 [Peronospora effusa]
MLQHVDPNVAKFVCIVPVLRAGQKKMLKPLVVRLQVLSSVVDAMRILEIPSSFKMQLTQYSSLMHYMITKRLENC